MICMLYHHLFQKYVSTPNSYAFITLWKLICSAKVLPLIKFIWQKYRPSLLFQPPLLLDLTWCATPPKHYPPTLIWGLRVLLHIIKMAVVDNVSFVELLYGIKYFLVSLSDIETIFIFIEKPNFGNILFLLFEKDAWVINIGVSIFAALTNLVSRNI